MEQPVLVERDPFCKLYDPIWHFVPIFTTFTGCCVRVYAMAAIIIDVSYKSLLYTNDKIILEDEFYEGKHGRLR